MSQQDEGSALPGLNRQAIQRLSSDWDDGGLWDDILYLAGQFLSASGAERTRMWHHLVLAVGNFKRQPGRRLRPPRLAHEPPSTTDRPNHAFVPVPGTSVTIGVEDRASWGEFLDETSGAGVATGTTLLAALWPDRHFVFDWRVQAAACGVRLHAGLGGTPTLDERAATAKAITLEDYAIVREWLLDVTATTDLPLAAVERALYRLSQSVPTVRGRTWLEYAEVVGARLQ